MNGSFKGRREQSKHYMSVHHHCNLSRRHHSSDTHRLQADNYVNTKRLSSALDTNNAAYVPDHYRPSFPKQNNNNKQKTETENNKTKQKPQHQPNPALRDPTYSYKSFHFCHCYRYDEITAHSHTRLRQTSMLSTRCGRERMTLS